jgi:hypothetical protein
MKERSLQDLLALARDMAQTNQGRNEIVQATSGTFYTVHPLRKMSEDGRVNLAQTLWLHCSGGWHWDFFSYQSDCYAWVTDAQDGGNAIAVDSITAYLSHDQCYGSGSDTQHNSPNAHAFTRINGVAVCQTAITIRACAEHRGYNPWCTNSWHG